MKRTFRVVAWNCRRASVTSRAWDYLAELAPDVALLQEFSALPPALSGVYSHAREFAATESNRSQRYGSGVLVKGTIDGNLPLTAPNEWVARELEVLRGCFVAKRVTLHNGLGLKVISAYSPAFPVDPQRLAGVDTTGVQLTQNRSVWGTGILWACLKEMKFGPADPLIVGGDLNSSETFDVLWRGGPRGNREIIERMNALGLSECLRTFKGGLTPTFRNPRGGQVIHQLDHLYVTEALMGRLRWCDVGSAMLVFGSVPSLSDHLPIVADFALEA